MAEFQVRRDALLQTRIADERSGPDMPLAPGAVLVRVDLFAFTVNNMTYGQVGDTLGYWQFFPVHDEGWGVIPVWGFADVVASENPELPVGERLYGYFPPAEYLMMQPGRIGVGHVIDATPHRRSLPIGYNTYTRVMAEPDYDRSQDALRALLFPLFITSFCLWDLLKEADWFGAERILILSASSKTAIGLAYALANDPDAPTFVGATSVRNVQMVQGLGLFETTLCYEDLAQFGADKPTAIVDMAGNGAILAAVHQRLGAQMLRTVQVGVTHRAQVRHDGIDTTRSGFFFAPTHIEQRMGDWGPAGFAERSGAFMRRAMGWSARWLQVQHVSGVAGLAQAFPAVAKGTLAADQGLVVRM